LQLQIPNLNPKPGELFFPSRQRTGFYRLINLAQRLTRRKSEFKLILPRTQMSINVESWGKAAGT
jgi:hypothetical protein